MKIGLFGGSFNPPHNVHKQILEYLLNNHYLDFIIVIPTGDYYPKSTLIPFKHRYEMVKLMFKHDSRIKVSDFEKSAQQIYTYQTIDHFKKEYPDDEIYFIMGADNFKDFENWKNKEYMLSNDQFLVINREQDIYEYQEKYKNFLGTFTFVMMEKPELSSTDIRSELQSKNKESLRNQLHPDVLNYILENNLY